MHIHGYCGVYWWDSVGRKVRTDCTLQIQRGRRVFEAAVSSLEVARRSRHRLHNDQCFQHLLTVCTHKYRLFGINYSIIWEEFLFLHVVSDRCFPLSLLSWAVCLQSLIWSALQWRSLARWQRCGTAVGIWWAGRQPTSLWWARLNARRCWGIAEGGEELHSAFFMKIWGRPEKPEDPVKATLPHTNQERPVWT